MIFCSAKVRISEAATGGRKTVKRLLAANREEIALRVVRADQKVSPATKPQAAADVPFIDASAHTRWVEQGMPA